MEDLALQVLEDFVDTGRRDNRSQDFRGLRAVKVGDELLKRNRPEGLVSQVHALVSTRPQGPWTVLSISNGLGWKLDRGLRVSLGLVMKELGWTMRRHHNGETEYTRGEVHSLALIQRQGELSERVSRLCASRDSWTLEEVNTALGREHTASSAQCVARVLKRQGWRAVRSYKYDPATKRVQAEAAKYVR